MWISVLLLVLVWTPMWMSVSSGLDVVTTIGSATCVRLNEGEVSAMTNVGLVVTEGSHMEGGFLTTQRAEHGGKMQSRATQ